MKGYGGFNKLRDNIKNRNTFMRIFKIIFGNILITSAYALITVPNKIVNGGVTSFSMILAGITGVNISVFINTFTLLLLFLCLIFLGVEFFKGSIFSCIAYLVFLNLFNSTGISLSANPFICTVLGGLLVGSGYYFCISAKSTAIGFDVVALIINKFIPKADIAVMMGTINIMVLSLGFINLGPMSVFLGIIFTIIQSFTLKKILAVRGINSDK